jgi:Uma2 family endonuclease
LLKTFVKTHQLGKVIISPFDVVLNENNVVVPDMLFVSVAKANILDGKKAQGSPDLLVEVWSPGNKKKERNTKRKLYEENGVLEFWEVFPKKNQVIVQTLNSEGSYEVFSEAQKTGAVRSKILEGFTLDIEALFEEEADISI